MKTLARIVLVMGLLIGAMPFLGGCADSNMQLQRPEPYRPTAAPASTQSPDFAQPKH